MVFFNQDFDGIVNGDHCGAGSTSKSFFDRLIMILDCVAYCWILHFMSCLRVAGSFV